MAGHAITVMDERNTPLPNATVWMGGKEYAASTSGEIMLPFAHSFTRTPLLLGHNGFFYPAELMHQAETYALEASFCVQREAAIRGNHTVQVLVRPMLTVASAPTSVTLLKRTRLSIGKQQ